jgi:protein-disulfide isomerase
MNTAAGIVGGLVVGAALGYGVATMNKGGARDTVDAVVLEMDGTKYKEADLPADIRASLYDVKTDAHDRQTGILNQFAMQYAIAKDKDKNTKIDALPALEDLLQAPAPSAQEIQAVYDANKSRLPPNVTVEQVKPEIERYLRNQKLSEAMRQKSEEFAVKRRYAIVVPEPQAPKVALTLDAYAAHGPAGSPNTLVEVADYLCPHCQQSQPEVEAVVKELGDKIRFVHVPFSLRPDGLSGTLARGAFCARQQGDESFWKYHEKAFATAKEKGWKASDAEDKAAVVQVATAAGIDGAKLEACLSSPEAQAFVKNTTESMHKAGVSGTPTFFLNNRRLSLSSKPLKLAITIGLQSTSH